MHVSEEERLPEGLYESVLSRALAERLQRHNLASEFGGIDDADLPDVLVRHLIPTLRRAFTGRRDSGDRLLLAAELLEFLQSEDESPVAQQQLLALTRPEGPGQRPWAGLRHRPVIPLSESALLTNAQGDPSVGAELRAEIGTADRVDLLMAFVMWPGLRILEDQLRGLRERGARFRVITTTYLGGTERAALDRLARDCGAEIRVQYDARRSRLHAKAWLFGRSTGFDTGYVGSSNLTRAALLDGIEWNVRLSRVAGPALLDKFQGTFESYWNSDQFEAYSPDSDRDRLDDALAQARGARGPQASTVVSGLQVRPFPYQRAILDAVAAERAVHDRHRNLIVAATGTGKTVMAALRL